MADLIEHQLNMYRDLRDGALELAFHLIYGSPLMRMIGEAEENRVKVAEQQDMRRLPEVQVALSRLNSGGFADGVIRMLVLMAHARGSVRRSRLERSNAILTSREPFKSMSDDERATIIRDQTLIVEFEADAARDALPALLPSKAERRRAMDIIEDIAGPREEMNASTLSMLASLNKILDDAPAKTSRPRAVKSAPEAAE